MTVMPVPAACTLRKGDELDMYLATGKKKHARVFWVDIGSRSVCWGKKRYAAAAAAPRLPRHGYSAVR